MATIIIRSKDKAEWLENRKGGIGASEVASIVGLNPYQTPYQLWRLKKELDPPFEGNDATEMGHLLEQVVATRWEQKTGREVIKASSEDFIIANKEKPFLRVSPDRTFWIPGEKRNNSNKGLLECKTTMMPIDPEDLPKSWFCQLQMQLGVSETEQGSLAWLVKGRDFGYKDMTLVPDFYGWLAEETEKFWVDNILGNKEPQPINSSDIVLKYATHTGGKTIEVGEEIVAAYMALKEVKEELDALEERKNNYEEILKMTFQDAEAIVSNGQTLATWKTSKDIEKIDTKGLAKAYPDLVKKYTITIQGSRRFTLK